MELQVNESKAASLLNDAGKRVFTSLLSYVSAIKVPNFIVCLTIFVDP